jgi:hypothetical protein
MLVCCRFSSDLRASAFFGREEGWEFDVSLVQSLACSGRFHPGQIIMTDFAFTLYRALQLTVTEVFDHGLHRVASHDIKVCFKEIIPGCLVGRESTALNYSDEVLQLSKGFHDAPALPGPMCICFCNIAMPQVRSWHFHCH